MSSLNSEASVRRAASRAARAVHGRARRVSIDHTRNVELGHIFQVTPIIVVEPVETAYRLEEGSGLRLTDQVRWWDANFGLKKGDPVAMVELPDHSWLCFAVLTDRSVVAGAKARKPPADWGKGEDFTDLDTASETGLLTATVNIPSLTVSASGADPQGGTVTSTGSTSPSSGVTVNLVWHYDIVAKIPVYHEDGTLIGFTPVFGSLPA